MKVKQIVVSFLATTLILAGCTVPLSSQSFPANGSGTDTAGSAGEKLNVAATVSPIANLVYNIGGDRIILAGLVPEGVNSHTFEVTPSDARVLAEADLIFVNGLDLEEPTIRLAEANMADEAQLVFLGEQTITPDEYVFDFSFPAEEGRPNPHLWMNPIYAQRYAEIIKDSLSEKDPAGSAYYQANYDALSARIAILDQAIQATVDTIPEENRRLLTYHDSFAYFAPRYGLTVLGAMQPSDFSEPSAREVADLIVQIREEEIPAVFGSEVFPSPVLERIAEESGATFVDTLRDDDLPGEPGDANHSYFGLIVEDVVTMARALGGDPSPVTNFDVSNIPHLD